MVAETYHQIVLLHRALFLYRYSVSTIVLCCCLVHVTACYENVDINVLKVYPEKI